MSEALDFNDAVSALMAAENEAPALNTNEVETGAEAATGDQEDSLTDVPEDGSELGGEDGLDENPATEDDVEVNEEDGGLETATGAFEFWDEEGKAALGNLDEEVFQAIERNVAKAAANAQKLIDSAALSRKAAESEAKANSAMRAEWEQSKIQAEKIFALRYAGVDWEHAFRVNPAQARQAQSQFEADKAALDQLDAMAAKHEQAELESYHKAQADALKAMGDADPAARDLLNPERGAENVQRLGEYIVNVVGVDPANVTKATAKELVTAYKAMRWDEAQAAKKTPPKTSNPVSKNPAAKMRPGANPSQPQASTNIRKQQNRFAQTTSREDAAALLLMMENETAKRRK